MNTIYDFIMKHKEPIKKVLPIGFLRKCKAIATSHKLKQYYSKPIHPSAFKKMPSGVNLIGDIRIEIGLGQSMRLISNVLDHSGQDFCIVNLPLNTEVRRNDHSWDHKISQAPVYRTNLFHICSIGVCYFFMLQLLLRLKFRSFNLVLRMLHL